MLDRSAANEYTDAQRRAVDAELAEGLEQARNGQTYGPFTHQEMMDFLHHAEAKARAQKRANRTPR